MRLDRLLLPVYEQTTAGLRPINGFDMDEAQLVLELLTELAVAQLSGELPDLWKDYVRIGPPPPKT